MFTRNVVLKTADFWRVYYASPSAVRDLLIAAMNTGMRYAELICLTWQDIDLENKVIHVPAGMNITGRLVPINALLRSHLEKMFIENPDNPVFMRKPIFHPIRKAAEITGMESFTFSDIRHSFAFWIMEGGYYFDVSSGLLGHLSSEVADNQAFPLPDAYVDAVEMVGEMLLRDRPEDVE